MRLYLTLVSVLLSASVERCFVSRMRDFFYGFHYFNFLDFGLVTCDRWQLKYDSFQKKNYKLLKYFLKLCIYPHTWIDSVSPVCSNFRVYKTKIESNYSTGETVYAGLSRELPYNVPKIYIFFILFPSWPCTQFSVPSKHCSPCPHSPLYSVPLALTSLYVFPAPYPLAPSCWLRVVFPPSLSRPPSFPTPSVRLETRKLVRKVRTSR